MRERGLKPKSAPARGAANWSCNMRREVSLPVRERGLKHDQQSDAFLGSDKANVAPRAGAWIETCRACGSQERVRKKSLPVRERGLKLSYDWLAIYN